jgi:hypothetical protein
MDTASFSTPRAPDGVIAQPSAPKFSSSHALIWSSENPAHQRDADPNAYRKASFCLSDHESKAEGFTQERHPAQKS